MLLHIPVSFLWEALLKMHVNYRIVNLTVQIHPTYHVEEALLFVVGLLKVFEISSYTSGTSTEPSRIGQSVEACFVVVGLLKL